MFSYLVVLLVLAFYVWWSLLRGFVSLVRVFFCCLGFAFWCMCDWLLWCSCGLRLGAILFGCVLVFSCVDGWFVSL